MGAWRNASPNRTRRNRASCTHCALTGGKTPKRTRTRRPRPACALHYWAGPGGAEGTVPEAQVTARAPSMSRDMNSALLDVVRTCEAQTKGGYNNAVLTGGHKNPIGLWCLDPNGQHITTIKQNNQTQCLHSERNLAVSNSCLVGHVRSRNIIF